MKSRDDLSQEFEAAVKLGLISREEAMNDQFGALAEQEKQPLMDWPFQSLEEIKALDLPPREPLNGPFSTAAVTIVAVERGTGKTMWMTEVAEAIASGEGFCDWKCHQRGKVVFIQLDMPIQAVQKRAKGRTWHPDFHYITRWNFQRAGKPGRSGRHGDKTWP